MSYDMGPAYESWDQQERNRKALEEAIANSVETLYRYNRFVRGVSPDGSGREVRDHMTKVCESLIEHGIQQAYKGE